MTDRWLYGYGGNSERSICSLGKLMQLCLETISKEERVNRAQDRVKPGVTLQMLSFSTMSFIRSFQSSKIYIKKQYAVDLTTLYHSSPTANFYRL